MRLRLWIRNSDCLGSKQLAGHARQPHWKATSSSVSAADQMAGFGLHPPAAYLIRSFNSYDVIDSRITISLFLAPPFLVSLPPSPLTLHPRHGYQGSEARLRVWRPVSFRAQSTILLRRVLIITKQSRCHWHFVRSSNRLLSVCFPLQRCFRLPTALVD